MASTRRQKRKRTKVAVESMDFREEVHGSTPLRVDAEKAIIYGVKYLGTESRNVNKDGSRNRYPMEARKAAAALYEGVKTYVDHGPEGSTQARSMRDKIGRLKNTQDVRADGSYAEWHLNPKHPLTEAILYDAEHEPDSLGLSHHARGMGRVSSDGAWCDINQINEVHSVDGVVAGATTKGLYEGERKPMDPLKDLTLDQLKEARPDLVELLEAPAPAAPPPPPAGDDEPPPPPAGDDEPDPAIKALTEANEALTKRLDEAESLRKAQAHQRAIDGLLEALPAAAVSDVFKASLLKGTLEEAAPLVEERRKMWLHTQPTTGRPLVEGDATKFSKSFETSKGFAASVKRGSR